MPPRRDSDDRLFWRLFRNLHAYGLPDDRICAYVATSGNSGMPSFAATFDERLDVWVDLPADYPMSGPAVEVTCRDPGDPAAVEQRDAVLRNAAALAADWSPALMSAGVVLLILYARV